MNTGKIVKLVAVLIALVAGASGGFPHSAIVIAILGAAGGYFIAAEDRMGFLVATVALTTVAGALNSVPGVGPLVTAALGSGGLTALFQAGAITAILVGTFEAVKP